MTGPPQQVLDRLQAPVLGQAESYPQPVLDPVPVLTREPEQAGCYPQLAMRVKASASARQRWEQVRELELEPEMRLQVSAQEQVTEPASKRRVRAKETVAPRAPVQEPDL